MNNEPIVTLETYAVPKDDSQPQSLGHIAAKSSELTLRFDPQGKFSYLMPRSGVGEIFPWQAGADGKPFGGTSATSLSVAWPTNYAFKSEGNLVLVAHGTPNDAPQHSKDGIAVYRQDCTTGALTLLKDNIFIDGVAGGPQFLSAAPTGNLVVGWISELPVPWSNFQYRVDPASGTLVPLENRIFGLMGTSFDSSGQFAVGRVMTENDSDSIAVFRVEVSGLVETDRYKIPWFGQAPQTLLSSPIFELSGSYIYGSTTRYLIGLKLDRSNGKLTPIAGYPEARNNTFDPFFIVTQ